MKIIGVDIDGTKIDAVLIEKKQIIKTLSYPTPSGKNKSGVITAVEKTIFELISKDVAGIGLGVRIIINNKLYSGRF